MSDDLEVAVYRRDGKCFALIGEELLPVANMLGSDGEECENYGDAVVVVAGPDKAGLWVTIELDGPIEGMH